MTDQKKSSADRKDSSGAPVALDADRRRRMREAAEAAAREAPGEWRTGEKGAAGYWLGFHAVTCDAAGEAAEVIHRAVLLQPNPYFPVEVISVHAVETQPAAVLAVLDALELAERELDALREKLAATERRVEELERPRETLKPLEWADVLAAEARVDDLRARGVTGEELAKAKTDMRVAKAAWGLDEHERAAR